MVGWVNPLWVQWDILGTGPNIPGTSSGALHPSCNTKQGSNNIKTDDGSGIRISLLMLVKYWRILWADGQQKISDQFLISFSNIVRTFTLDCLAYILRNSSRDWHFCLCCSQINLQEPVDYITLPELYSLRRQPFLLPLIQIFLPLRHHRVEHQDVFPDCDSITSGVPEGERLNQAIFLVSINGLSSNVLISTADS